MPSPAGGIGRARARFLMVKDLMVVVAEVAYTSLFEPAFPENACRESLHTRHITFRLSAFGAIDAFRLLHGTVARSLKTRDPSFSNA